MNCRERSNVVRLRPREGASERSIQRQPQSSGITIDRESDCTADVFIGSRSDLQEAGLVRPGDFPGDPGNGRVMLTVLPDGSRKRQGAKNSPPGTRQIRKRGTGRFEVRVRVDSNERERRHAALMAAWKRRGDAEARLARAAEGAALFEGWVAALPDSEAAYRRREEQSMVGSLEFQIDWIAAHSKGGFAYSPTVIQQIKQVATWLHVLLMNGTVEFRVERLEAELKALRDDVSTRFGTCVRPPPSLRLVSR